MLDLYPTIKRARVTSLIVVVLMALIATMVVPAQASFAANVPQQGTTSQDLNVRSGPGVEFEIVDVLPTGQDVTILGQNAAGSWYRIAYGEGAWGWSAARYIELQPALASIEVLNDTPIDVCWLYVAPTTSPYWGDDRLGPSTILAAGDSFVVEVDPGQYDVLAGGCDGNVVAAIYEITIDSDTVVVSLYDTDYYY